MTKAQTAQEYRVQKVTAKVIMEVVEGCSHSGLSVKDAAEYVGVSVEYARRAVDIATQFGMPVESSGTYSLAPDVENVAKADEEQKRIIFRKYLQRYEPIIIFISLLSKGNNPEVAARKVGVIYAINNGKDNIENMFLEWGRYAGIIEESE
ncbi:AAA-associated domain-containing protein [Candidatus Nitrososphaera gargensis]|uniref:AAA-associated domain-containing protein n=1 Tax=Candidatus Nitrososphaera gargensis TaxID=497727 RepID=UPI0011E4FA65|nr:AAA-associated domain-containing protein [Candidatus Nitrososphaera gargensis]